MSVMTANFTFRFPPKSGHSYNVPTYAFFADDTSAKWTTTFKNSKFSLTHPSLISKGLCSTKCFNAISY